MALAAQKVTAGVVTKLLDLNNLRQYHNPIHLRIVRTGDRAIRQQLQQQPWPHAGNLFMVLISSEGMLPELMMPERFQDIAELKAMNDI